MNGKIKPRKKLPQKVGVRKQTDRQHLLGEVSSPESRAVQITHHLPASARAWSRIIKLHPRSLGGLSPPRCFVRSKVTGKNRVVYKLMAAF